MCLLQRKVTLEEMQEMLELKYEGMQRNRNRNSANSLRALQSNPNA